MRIQEHKNTPQKTIGRLVGAGGQWQVFGCLQAFLVVLLTLAAQSVEAESVNLTALAAQLPESQATEAGQGKDEQTQAAELQQEGQEEERWSDFLPFLKKQALEHLPEGASLPLPFGINFNVVAISRDTEIDNVKAGLNKDPRPVTFADVGTSSNAYNASFRFDAWIFPFLNLYVLGGITDSSSEIAVTIDLEEQLPEEINLPNPIPGRPPIVVPIPDEAGKAFIQFPTANTGNTYGGGLVIAGGSGNFFSAINSSYTLTDLGGQFGEEIEAIVTSLRLGYETNFQGTSAYLWLSTTYWDNKRELSGSISLNDNGDVINFSVVQGPTDPWSYGIGGQATFSKEWQVVLMLDTNFDDMNSIVTNLSYRF